MCELIRIGIFWIVFSCICFASYPKEWKDGRTLQEAFVFKYSSDKKTEVLDQIVIGEKKRADDVGKSMEGDKLMAFLRKNGYTGYVYLSWAYAVDGSRPSKKTVVAKSSMLWIKDGKVEIDGRSYDLASLVSVLEREVSRESLE